MRAALLLVVFAGCIRTDTVVCANGDVCPSGTTCVTSEDFTLCVAPEQIAACEGHEALGECGTDARCYEVSEGLVCVAAECGNGFVDPDEQCDDRNNVSEDGCSGDCRSNEHCGNGVTDPYLGEKCDDNNLMSHDGCSSTCTLEAARWIEHLTPYFSSGAVGNGLAFDTRRGELVIFGGASSFGPRRDVRNPTHVWRNGWRFAPVSAGPVARTDATVAYDEKHGETIMFGGLGEGGWLADAWAWNGVDWHVIEALGPTRRSGAAMTYDPVHDRMVMFGGVYKGSPIDETWQLANGTWTLFQGTGGPIAQESSTLAFDRDTDKVVLVTGTTHWELDDTTWTRVGTTPCDGECSLVYEGASRRMLLLGHAPNQPVSVWAWTGQWTLVSTTTAQIDGHLFAADTLHGGVLAKRDGDILRWTGGDFVLQPNNPDPITPINSIGHAAVNDPTRGRAIVFGGNVRSPLSPLVIDETWAFDGLHWQQLSPAQKPPPRWEHAMAYDAKRDQIVLFGGSDTNGYLSDTWIWNGTNWAPGPAGPSARAGAAMAYDAIRDRVVLFGGHNGVNLATLGDTWEWDGTAWTQSAAPTPPGERTSAGLAFDPIRGELIMFGGGTRIVDVNGTQQLIEGFADTWKYDGVDWHLLSPVVAPSPRGRTSLTWNAVRKCLVVIGGESTRPILGTGKARELRDDIWEWDGSSWRQVDVTSDPRSWHATVATPDGTGVAIIAGENQLETGLVSAELRWDGVGPYETCQTRVDADGDGLAACDDPDCNPRCRPWCIPGVPCDPQGVRCGDGSCSSIEDAYVCPEDCGAPSPVCGDLVCDGTEACIGDC